MISSTLSTADLVDWAIKHYRGVAIEEDEILKDLQRLRYIYRLLNQYSTSGVIKIRLVLNHIQLLYNVFDTDIATNLLLTKFAKHPKIYSYLVTFLCCMNRLPHKYHTSVDEKLKQLIQAELRNSDVF